jgi:hypothetical protein
MKDSFDQSNAARKKAPQSAAPSMIALNERYFV